MGLLIAAALLLGGYATAYVASEDVRYVTRAGIEETKILTARVPMVALSGFGSETDRAKSRQAGFDRHMLKPFDLADLEQMLGLLGAPSN